MMPGCGKSDTSPLPADRQRRVLIVAGEASGDLYGADLVTKALILDPGLSFFGVGGVRMREAGVETLIDSAAMAVMGLVEVAKHFGAIAGAFFKLKRILHNNPPDLLILIDYPGFNLRLAKVAKQAGVKVLYYISPKVWAWKAGRIKAIAASVNRMAVIFPFEVPLYENAGVPVTFVGHPLLDFVNVALDQSAAAASFNLDPARKIVGLFPGSRHNEIEKLLPTIISAAVNLQKRFPGIQFILPLASTLRNDDIVPQLAAANLDVVITRERIYDVIRSCDAVISVSGTVTLEIALIGTPMVIIYKLAPLTYQLAKRLVKIPHVGLCNIVAGERLVPELLQDDASPEKIAAEISRYLEDHDYSSSVREKLLTVRESLGEAGAAWRVATLAIEIMNIEE